MVCKQCGCEIPRGKKFTQTKYKSIPFCSEKCFNDYDLQYQPAPQRQFTDYIQSICDIEPNWPYIAKQIKAIEKEYGLSCKQQLLIVRYAVEFDGAQYNSNYGLGQFFPKYIEPCKRFIAALKENEQSADKVSEDEVQTVCSPNRVSRRKREDLEF